MLHSDQHQPGAARWLLAALGRLSVRLQEAGEGAAILRVLDQGLRELSLIGFVGRLEPDAQAVRLFAAGARSTPRPVPTLPLGYRASVELSPLLTRVVRSRETIFTTDVTAQLGPILPPPGAPEAEQLAGLGERARAICGPMVAHERIGGVLLVFGSDLEDEHAPAVRVLADHLAVALENATLLRDLKQALLKEHATARELGRLEELIAELFAAPAPESLPRRVAVIAADALGVARVGLYLRPDEAPSLALAASIGLDAELDAALREIPVGPEGGSLGRAAADGLPTIVEDTHRDEAGTPLAAGCALAGLRSVWAVPLVSREGERLGLLAIFSERPGRPAAGQLELAQRFARHAANAIASARRHEAELNLARTTALIELARAIPHELRQPLSEIKGYAELVAKGRFDGPELREACRDIVASAATLDELVGRLERITSYATKDFGPGRTMIDLIRASE